MVVISDFLFWVQFLANCFNVHPQSESAKKYLRWSDFADILEVNYFVLVKVSLKIPLKTISNENPLTRKPRMPVVLLSNNFSCFNLYFMHYLEIKKHSSWGATEMSSGIYKVKNPFIFQLLWTLKIESLSIRLFWN